MKKIVFLFCLFLSTTILHAQETETNSEDEEETFFDDESLNYQERGPFQLLDTLEAQIGIFAVTTPFSNQQSFGGALDIKVRYTNNLSAGFSVLATGRKIRPDFGYIIGQPRMLFYDFSIFNEFDFYRSNRFEAAARLYTGLSVFNLADNSLKEKYWWYDEYGIEYEGERAVTIANNYFFRIAPSIVLRYKPSYSVAIEASTGYNFFVGNAQFGNRSAFQNYTIQLGARIAIN